MSACGLVLLERAHEVDHPALQQVVAEVHDEGRVAEERLGRQHRVREARGLVLDDVGEPDAELGTVARRLPDLVAGLRRDDDPDVADPRLGHGLDAEEEHRLVGHRHQLLGRRVGDRPQPRAAATGQDQASEVRHSPGTLARGWNDKPSGGAVAGAVTPAPYPRSVSMPRAER